MKKCEHQQTTFRLKIHTPATVLHHHIDKVIQIKEKTDWEAWAHLISESLQAMGYTNDRFIIGFLLDLINSLPVELRLAIGQGIVEGRGLEIKSVQDEEGIAIEASLPQRYEPLAGERKTESGLILPNQPPQSKLVLPKEKK